MRPAIFIDTSYFLALVNNRDKYPQAAQALATIAKPPFITSDAVLFELGNALSRPPQRQLGIQALRQIQADSRIEIVHVNPDLLAEAIVLFQTRPDQAWGLTDCSSFVIMQQFGAREALTADKHFEQAGFIRLLKLP
ncbi:MAG TPA: PIN domain-containing protein [Chloroflexota bacterium]|nr:PIN domain-containing protein [Chloroflexota bacterium]